MSRTLLIVFLLGVSLSPVAQVNMDSLIEKTNESGVGLENTFFELGLNIRPEYIDTVIHIVDHKLDAEKNKQNRSMMLFAKGAALNLQESFYDAQSVLEEAYALLDTDDAFKNAKMNHELGRSYIWISDYESAIDPYLRAVDYLNNSPFDKRTFYGVYNGVSTCYRRIGEYETALKWQDRGIEIAKEQEDTNAVVGFIRGKALIKIDQGYYNEADSLLRWCAGAIDRPDAAIAYYENMGSNFLSWQKPDSAMLYFEKSLELSEQTKDEFWTMIGHMNIGILYLDLEDFKLAERHCSKALSIADTLHVLIRQKQACDCLYKSNYELGNFKAAFDYLQLYRIYGDSVMNQSKYKELIKRDRDFEITEAHLKDSLQNAQQLAIEKRKSEQEIEQQRIYTIGGIIGFIFMLLLALLGYRGYRIKKRSAGILEEKNQLITKQKKIVEEKNQEIIDSMEYAKRIQAAILPPDSLVQSVLPDSFVLYLPKDIVAGDFYWLEQKNNTTYIAAADCTGHGVPGAMVSVICNNALNRSVREFGANEPNEILNKARELVISEFEKSEDEVKDGMDIALCAIEGAKLRFSGAHNPLWIVRNGELLETKADKQPVGKFAASKNFTNQLIELQRGDQIYLFSDGYADQFGGPKGKKFKAKSFKDLLIEIKDKNMSEQKVILQTTIRKWRGELEQVDDICVIGIKIN